MSSSGYARNKLGPLAGALVVLAACDSGSLSSNAVLHVEPASIDFGAVPTGETRTVELRVSNSAARGDLQIQHLGLAEASASAFSLPGAPEHTIIAPGAELVVLVRYRADDDRADAGAVEIVSDGVGTSVVRVPLSSGRTHPKIAISPASLDLGSIASGSRAEGSVTITSAGDATLEVRRVALRTDGFLGEPCAADGDCREGVCATSRTGLICAKPCSTDQAACPTGYTCLLGTDGTRACTEADGTAPPTSARGFTISASSLPALPPLLPSATAAIDVTYAPGENDRGSAQLVVESNDPDRPIVVVPLAGRPDNLPPIAFAAIDGAPPNPIGPGTRVPLTSAGSYDPEGARLAFAWRFLSRPEGSRARFEDPSGAATAFRVDLPGTYVVHLEARDETGLASTNDARVELTAGPGSRVRVVLAWDRPEADLDLHLLAPGASLGSLGDCFFDNPTPDFPPEGPQSDPTLTNTSTTETITLEHAGPGVYTLAARIVTASPRGATLATLSIFLDDVEAAVLEATLAPGDEAWDIATLTWPSGRLTLLGTIH